MSKLKYAKKFRKDSTSGNIQEDLIKNKFDSNYNTKLKNNYSKKFYNYWASRKYSKDSSKKNFIIIGLLENTQRILRIYPHQTKTSKKTLSQIISFLIKIIQILPTLKVQLQILKESIKQNCANFTN